MVIDVIVWWSWKIVMVIIGPLMIPGRLNTHSGYGCGLMMVDGQKTGAAKLHGKRGCSGVWPDERATWRSCACGPDGLDGGGILPWRRGSGEAAAGGGIWKFHWNPRSIWLMSFNITDYDVDTSGWLHIRPCPKIGYPKIWWLMIIFPLCTMAIYILGIAYFQPNPCGSIKQNE